MTIAGSGEDGVSAATSGHHDMILMDCQMPGIDGYEATRRIRAWEVRHGEVGRQRHVPVIALTANAMHANREACLSAGMDDFISKPFNRSTLLQTVERWTNARPSPIAMTADAVPAQQGKQDAATTFDASMLEDLRAIGDDTFVANMVRAFAKSAAADVAAMRQALAADDGTALAAHAHSLKSASAQLGLVAVSARARSLEALGRAGNVGAAVADVATLQDEYEVGMVTLHAACGMPT